MQMTQDQLKPILQDAQTKGLDPNEVVRGFLAEGVEIEGLQVKGDDVVSSPRQQRPKLINAGILSDAASNITRRGVDILQREEETGQSRLESVAQLAGAGVSEALNTVVGKPLKFIDEKLLGGRGEAAIQKGVDAISDTQVVQELAGVVSNLQETNPRLASNLGAALELADLATLGLGGRAVKAGREATEEAISKTAQKAGQAIAEKTAPIRTAVTDVVEDIVPTATDLKDNAIVQRLGLTANDLDNLKAPDGTEVTTFFKEKNLKVGDKPEQIARILEKSKEADMSAVRDAINSVDKAYTNEVGAARAKQVLTKIAEDAQDSLGLEALFDEASNLARKESYTLSDIQRSKELMDVAFDLYKTSGEAKSGLTKTGFQNIRKDIKGFIEKEALDNTGVNVRDLNRDVALAKGIADTAIKRTGRQLGRKVLGLTDNLTLGASLGVGLFNPALGIGLFAAKKLLDSPQFKYFLGEALEKLPRAKQTLISNNLNKTKPSKEYIELMKGIVDDFQGAAVVTSVTPSADQQ